MGNIMWLLVNAYCLLTGATALVFVLMAASSQIRAIQSWQMRRLAKRVGLGIPADLDRKIRRRVSSSRLWSALGGLAALGIGLGIQVVIDAQTSPATFCGILIAALVGYHAGATVVSALHEIRRDTRSRVARIDRVDLDDYLPPGLRQLAWALLALSLIATAIALSAIPASERWDFPAPQRVGGVALIAACLLAFEILGRRLVQRGQPAASTDELVWNDALRSSALIAALAAVTVILLACNLLQLPQGLLFPETNWAFIPVGVFVVGYVLIRRMLRNANTWYLSRLWHGARRRTPEEEEARQEQIGRMVAHP
jgi:hypothetical protein